MSNPVLKKNKNSREFIEEIKENVKPIIDEVIKPNAEIIDREGKFPRENFLALAKEGWTSVTLPKKWGGLDLGYVGFSAVAEEIGRVDASTGLVFAMHVAAAQFINLFGYEEQKERWFLKIREGALGTFSISEKATGGHVWYSLSQAERDGDFYILNAEKSFTTSGGQSDFYVFQTRSANSNDPSEQSFFIVNGHSNGITAKPWNALGVRGNHSGPLTFENVQVHKQDLLNAKAGDPDASGGLLGLNAVWLGVAQGALDAAIKHVKKTVHKDFNRSLADYQVIRQKLAEVKIKISGLRAWQYELARYHDEILASGGSLLPLATEVSELKVQATELADFAARVAMDVAGGYGYINGIFERLYRDARGGIPMAPSNNLAREQIGKQLVGLPLELWELGK
ncbi:acyl-CoA dehydrogenase family protein [Metabacillus niabensis]|uniref:Alkylation response protein AidB-like acyl-CoA dehydrogenase n=1 Tax=Metabacillus niabensis TaxID=324854 RepID=A0ABT9Z3R3_9BACI|nr:acyl-CoA dehydrogenase family protein [Metabacillus niabensis]MDQ0226188.1 alkylation response protein AidB-like acyl-CoA dehydrogenase [Metabacillus niabensis]